MAQLAVINPDSLHGWPPKSPAETVCHMALSKVETHLYTSLNDFLSQKDFEMRPDLKQFRRETPTGFQNIILSFSPYQAETYLEVNIGTRLNMVEEIVQQFLDNMPEFWRQANTVVVSVGKINDAKYFRYRIADDEDLHVCTEQVIEFMDQRGFMFLEYASHLKNLDVMFNAKPHQSVKYLYNQLHRCFKGVVIARLSHNPHFLTLIEQYHDKLLKLGASPTNMAEYDRLVNYLLHFSAN